MLSWLGIHCNPLNSVFVLPPDAVVGERVSRNGDAYWKLRIVSIHREVDGTHWVLGTWFYSSEHLSLVKLQPM